MASCNFSHGGISTICNSLAQKPILQHSLIFPQKSQKSCFTLNPVKKCGLFAVQARVSNGSSVSGSKIARNCGIATIDNVRVSKNNVKNFGVLGALATDEVEGVEEEEEERDEKKPRKAKRITANSKSEAYALGQFIPTCANKVRRVVDQIRGRSYEEALLILELMPYRACDPVLKLVYSAAANAKNKLGSNETNLVISAAEVNEGRTMKRMRPVSRGQSHRIRKRTCKVKIVMNDVSLASA